jgi:hypothetical protein
MKNLYTEVVKLIFKLANYEMFYVDRVYHFMSSRVRKLLPKSKRTV